VRDAVRDAGVFRDAVRDAGVLRDAGSGVVTSERCSERCRSIE